MLTSTLKDAGVVRTEINPMSPWLVTVKSVRKAIESRVQDSSCYVRSDTSKTLSLIRPLTGLCVQASRSRRRLLHQTKGCNLAGERKQTSTGKLVSNMSLAAWHTGGALQRYGLYSRGQFHERLAAIWKNTPHCDCTLAWLSGRNERSHSASWS